MRQIKFRAMKESNGKWVYGQYAYRKDSDEHFIVDSLMHVDGWEWNADADYIKAETVGQYTGIKDNNGVEIYEGDYIKAYIETPRSYCNPDDNVHLIHGRVFFHSGCFLFGDFYCFDTEHIAGIEVIGNIHENTELLEKRYEAN